MPKKSPTKQIHLHFRIELYEGLSRNAELLRATGHRFELFERREGLRAPLGLRVGIFREALRFVLDKSLKTVTCLNQ